VRITDLFKRFPAQVTLSITQPKKSTSRELRAEEGAGGVSYVGGIIDSDEFNSKLTGLEAIQTYDKMRRTDAQVAGTIAACTLPVLAATPVIDRPDDKAAADNIADEHLEFARHNLFTRIDFPAFMRHAASCLWAGFAWAEKVYGVVDGQLVLVALAPRLASTVDKWWTDPSGKLIGLTQKVFKDGAYRDIDIPRDKFAHFTYQQEANNYQGLSALRSIYRHWLIKDTLYRLDAIRAERFAVGVPVITLPDEYTDAQYAMAQTIGKQWKGAEQSFAVKVAGMGIEILSVKGGETLDLTAQIKHHNEEIAKALLVQFINYGTTETGSRALGDSSMAFFYDASKAWARELASVIERDVIWPLMDLNFANRPRPQLTFEDIGSVSLSAVTAALRDLGPYFITPGLDVENALRPKLDLPLREIEEEPEPVVEAQPEEPQAVEIDGEEADQEEAPADVPEKAAATANPPHVHLVAQDQVPIRAEDEFWRPLRPVERHISLRAIRGMLDDSRDRILRILLGLKKDWGPLLADQMRQLYPSGPAALETLVLPDDVVIEAIDQITPVLDGAFDFGEQQVRKELQSQATEKDQKLSRRLEIRRKEIFRRQAKMLFRDEISEDEVSELIQARARILITRLKRKTEDAAKLMAIDKYRTQGGEALKDADIDTVVGYIFDSVEKESRVTAATVVSEALNLGRDAAAERLIQDIEVAVYSAILDNSTCFPAGQRVLTDSGWKQIETVQVGDLVMTHKNRYRKVLRSISRRHTGAMVETCADGLIARSTADHKFLTNRGWAEIGGLKEGDDLIAFSEDCGETEHHCCSNGPIEVGVGDSNDINSLTFDKRRFLGVGMTDRSHTINISKIAEYTSSDLQVYDLEIESDHSFIVEGFVVHNCGQCEQADGFEAQVGSSEYYDATPPLSSSQFGECDGMGQCRCIWAYTLKEERNQ
jgi:hypothetical protein